MHSKEKEELGYCLFFSDTEAPSGWFCHNILNFLSYTDKKSASNSGCMQQT